MQKVSLSLGTFPHIQSVYGHTPFKFSDSSPEVLDKIVEWALDQEPGKFKVYKHTLRQEVSNSKVIKKSFSYSDSDGPGGMKTVAYDEYHSDIEYIVDIYYQEKI